ncbi:MAG: hypothetical protein OXU21_03210 [Chloroflexota bacterium]|nr:hypothetical protein [Chloroflexota bacterium]
MTSDEINGKMPEKDEDEINGEMPVHDDLEKADPEKAEAPPAPLDMPRDVQQIFQQAFAMVSGPMRSPFWDAFTSEHLTAVIDGQAKESEREHIDRHRSRVFQVILLSLAIIAVFGVLAIAVWGNAREILLPVIGTLAGLIGGYGIGRGGYGAGRRIGD